VIGPIQGRAARRALGASGGRGAATVAGSGPHAAEPRVSMAAADYANHRVDYRVVGAYVQRSTDGGRHWARALDPGGHPRLRDRSCHPARYQTIENLRVAGLFPESLLVASRGTPGAHGLGCGAATGGLFVLRPDGRGGLRGTAALASGLPYTQARARAAVTSRTGKARGIPAASRGQVNNAPRTYDLLDIVADPTNPAMLYAEADGATGSLGPGSPPAGLYRSTDNGLHWRAAMRGLSGRVEHASLALDPAHGATLFDVVGTAVGPTLYRSVDHGEQWSAVRGVTAARTLSLFINPADPSLVYALTDRALYHSRNAGATWAPFPRAGLPPAGAIQTLLFDPRDPSLVLIKTTRGAALRLREQRAPAPPRFDLALTLTLRAYDRVVLALHAAPLARARLVVVGGAAGTSARLTTDGHGFGYATVALDGRVTPSALRVRVELAGRSEVLQPWTPSGYIPGRAAPAATPTPTMTPSATMSPTTTATPSPTATMTPTATITPTTIPIATAVAPTPYPPNSLDQGWQWQQRGGALPLCPPPSAVVAPVSATATLAPATAPPTTTATPTPAIGAPPTPTVAAVGAPPPVAPATSTPSSTVTSAPTVTSVPTATPTPIGLCDAGPPPPRQDYAAGWDNSGRKLYVFGGTDSKTAASYNDLSAYSAITNAWTMIAPATPVIPTGRYGASSVWDPGQNVLLVFGGMSGAGPYARFTDDVWAYAPATNTWANLSPNGAPGAPSPRAHAAAAWDASNGRLLIFGGQTNDLYPSTLTNDLWAFTPSATGGTWANLSPNSGDQSLPPPRQWAQMAWDGGTLRLFGGKNPGNGASSDTWTWTPSTGWAFQNLADQPPGAASAGYDWDTTHGRLVIGAGLAITGASSDVWDYDPNTSVWARVPIANPSALAPRQMARLVWDAADKQALVFGGRQGGGPGVLPSVSNDLWALVPTGAPGPAAAPTPAPAAVAKGVNLADTVHAYNNGLYLTNKTVAAVAASGAAYARISFSIGDGATAWTGARLHAYEQVVNMLNAKGIGVLAVAGNGITSGWSAASWTQGAQETSGGTGDNPAIQDYVRELKVLVGHFAAPPYNVTHWELWNEPNVALANCTQGDPTAQCLQHPGLQPSNFAALLAESYSAIKGSDAGDLHLQGVQLTSGGIFGHSIAGSYSATASGADYIAHTYDEGINRPGGAWASIKASLGTYPLDLVGEHLYVDQGQRTTPALLRAYLNWFHAAYAGSDPSKATSITEAGWRTGDVNEPHVTPDMQAYNLGTIFETARRSGFVQDLLWYELQDNPGDLNSTSWGLLDSAGGGKPAYTIFQQQ